MLRGFLFDLDGTLVDSERETAEAMARALLRGQGIAIEQYDRDFIIGRSWLAIYDSLEVVLPAAQLEPRGDDRAGPRCCATRYSPSRGSRCCPARAT